MFIKQRNQKISLQENEEQSNKDKFCKNNTKTKGKTK